ncbi:UspA [Dillenia turbinata]|uniref:UspA n=1 Tax=Dillenia turbinata TaxID=194707 RepID=A0AAN8ULA2_9MAGN
MQSQTNHSPPATTTFHRKIAIAVDLGEESASVVKWAIQNYLRPTDTVILLHVRPTSALCGADWGPLTEEHDMDTFTTTKATALSQALVESKIPFKIHIVKDHDMKERLCLETERLGLSALIMGSKSSSFGKGSRPGGVSEYCARNCVCPVVVVRLPENKDGSARGGRAIGEEVELLIDTVPEEEEENLDDTP